MDALPEMRFLAQCLPSPSREVPHQQTQNNDLATLPRLNWEKLIDLAVLHGMFPLLVARIFKSEALTEAVPPAVLSAMKAQQAGYLGRTIMQLGALGELQRAFDHAGLRVVSWKGPSAGLLLYGGATLRDSADLDFLFLEEDLPRVMAIMRQLGYELLGQTSSESKDIYILTRHREFTFGRRADQMVLEFHLQIMPARFALWQDSQEDIARANLNYPLGDVTLLLQRPEDLLVSLCAHATKHNWELLKWSADIAQFMKLYAATIAWEPLLERLKRQRKDLVVLLGLGVAEAIYSIALPQEVVDGLQRSPRLPSLVSHLTAHVMSGAGELTDRNDRKALANLLCPRIRDRLAYALLPIVELNYEDLYIPVQNRKLFFVNYLFRVLRLMRKYGPQRLATKTAGSVRSVH